MWGHDKNEEDKIKKLYRGTGTCVLSVAEWRNKEEKKKRNIREGSSGAPGRARAERVRGYQIRLLKVGRLFLGVWRLIEQFTRPTRQLLFLWTCTRARHAHASMPPHKTVDYSKWDNLDDSDDEDKPKADHVAEYTAATIAKRKQEEEEKRRQDAEKAGLDAAITAAAMASSMGNAEALDEMMAQTQAAAPLAPEMEKIIRSLPAAAQIAARASAATMAAAGPMAGGGKEPTLAELLKVQKITVDAEDPGLEDVREFFETADEAAAVEPAAERAAAITVAQMRERDVRSRPPARADVVEIG